MKEFLQNNVTLIVVGAVVLAVLLWWTGILEGCSPVAEGVSAVSPSVTVPHGTDEVPSVNTANTGINTPLDGNTAATPGANIGTVPAPGNTESSQ